MRAIAFWGGQKCVSVALRRNRFWGGQKCVSVALRRNRLWGGQKCVSVALLQAVRFLGCGRAIAKRDLEIAAIIQTDTLFWEKTLWN